MKVLLGGGVLAASGSIGGQTASHNRFGNYFRARTTPVNPQSSRQNIMRAVIQNLAQRWSNVLTQAQRDQWEVYADNIVRTDSLGSQMKLTGFNHFIRSNSIRLQSADNTIGDGPIILTLPPGDPVFACTVDVAGQQISVAYDPLLDWNDQDFGHMYVFMSLPKAAGVQFIGGPWRLAGDFIGIQGAPPASPQVLSVPFPVGLDQQVKCYARISEEDGRLSDRFFHQSAVVA